MITDIFKSDTAIIFLSILLGFGLSTVFKSVCRGGPNCYIIQGPALKDVEGVVYRIDDSCFKYTREYTSCTEE
jgi:hypothetical protein